MSLRLLHALQTGALSLPEGRIAVFAPRAGMALPGDPGQPGAPGRLQVITGFRPDHDWFAARGFDCVRSPSGTFAAALVCIPRAREAARGLIARAAALVPEGLLLVEGERTDGIDALWRELRARLPQAECLSKAHGRLIWAAAPGPEPLADWQEAARPRRLALPQGPWWTVPGAFSADGPDPGSQALAAALPPLTGRVADLGAGWGYLSARLLAASPAVSEAHLIEAEAEALDCARRNLTDPRARFHWADALQPLPGAPFDAVLCNPPFHQGRQADPALGRAFIAAAARALTPRGTLWLVANRHLAYDAALAEGFAEVEPLPAPAAYRLFRASRPRRPRR